MTLARSRWIAKKVSRAALVAATKHLPRSRAVARVLTYHRFGRITRDPFCVTAEDFEAHVALLAREGRAVSLEDVHAFAKGQRHLPADACLVTMDDGYLSMLEVALPILARHRVPSVAFVTASFVDAARIEGQPEPFLTKAQLRAMHEGGMTIGAHAFTHRSLGRLSMDETVDEVTRAKKTLEDAIGAPVTSFAYPFGTHGDFSDATDRALEDAGYDIAFHSQHGPVVPGMITRGATLRSLPRIKIESGEPLAQLDAISRGAMDAWSVVDRNLWRLQRVRQDVVPSAT
ncbi:MAG: polysaccharide deacetylase family protein [Deltaproteobacteria bacterium]|nr:polysaccharide deacetylase family protein [Deltaproteobacteria bacterium]